MEEERGSGLSAQASQWISKDQINLLEYLFRHGIQTPNASQIQQITAKLRDYGNIDENDVSIWFQNYYQRKNEENSTCILHQTPPLPHISPPLQLLSPLTPHVYTNGQAGSVSYYHPQCPNNLSPEATRKRQVPELQRSEMTSDGNICGASNEFVPLKTLQLFPLHPDGTLSSFARSQNKRRRVEEDDNVRFSTFFQFFGGRSDD